MILFFFFWNKDTTIHCVLCRTSVAIACRCGALSQCIALLSFFGLLFFEGKPVLSLQQPRLAFKNYKVENRSVSRYGRPTLGYSMPRQALPGTLCWTHRHHLTVANRNWRITFTRLVPICHCYHSGIYGHKNKTQIFEIVAFVLQFYTHFNTYDMN